MGIAAAAMVDDAAATSVRIAAPGRRLLENVTAESSAPAPVAVLGLGVGSDAGGTTGSAGSPG